MNDTYFSWSPLIGWVGEWWNSWGGSSEGSHGRGWSSRGSSGMHDNLTLCWLYLIWMVYICLVCSISWVRILSRAKHSRTNTVQKVCVEQLCTLCTWRRRWSRGQRKATGKEVGWPYPKQSSAVGMHGCERLSKKVSQNGGMLMIIHTLRSSLQSIYRNSACAPTFWKSNLYYTAKTKRLLLFCDSYLQLGPIFLMKH